MSYFGNTFNKTRGQRLQKKKYIYSKKTYSNPFFRHKRAATSRLDVLLSNKFKLTVFSSAVIILILIWLLFFSTLFKITKIEISPAGDNVAADAEALAWGVAENRLIGKNNLLLYNKNELSSLLNEKYYLQTLIIQKKIFHTLKITLKEKQQVAAWYENDKYFYLDEDGNIITQVDPLNVNRLSYPLIENLTGITIEGRQANIDRQTIDYIMAIFNEFKDKKHELEIEKFIVDKNINTVKMAVLTGPKIYFNIKETVAEQTAQLDQIIKEQLQDNFKSKEYIDLRWGKGAYIK